MQVGRTQKFNILILVDYWYESYFISDISIFESLDFATYIKGQDKKAIIEANMAEDLIQFLPSILHFI